MYICFPMLPTDMFIESGNDKKINLFDRKLHLQKPEKKNLCLVSLENGFMVRGMQCVLNFISVKTDCFKKIYCSIPLHFLYVKPLFLTESEIILNHNLF